MLLFRKRLALQLVLLGTLVAVSSSWSTSSSALRSRRFSVPSMNLVTLQLSSPASSSSGSDTQQTQQQQQPLPEEEFYRDPSKPSSEDWELDCYSRPVVMGGKKLWEVLITDSTGSFRYCKRLPSANVNSKTLRQVVESLMDSTEVTKPSIIRFFRSAMFNMVSTAPKRCSDGKAMAYPTMRFLGSFAHSSHYPLRSFLQM